jgi:hypothetical protein
MPIRIILEIPVYTEIWAKATEDSKGTLRDQSASAEEVNLR